MASAACAALLPPDTTGGFPGDYYSSAYNAAQGAAGLASADHRDQGIVNYEFMIANSQSGPLSWWESSSAPDPRSPWVGRHPSTGQGSSPHAWGMAGANKVLLDSLVAQRSDGSLVVGRGVPPGVARPWRADLGDQLPDDGRPARRPHHLVLRPLGLADPARRPGRRDPSSSNCRPSSTTLRPPRPGTVDQATGTVTLAPAVRHVTVTLRRAP